MKGRDVFMCMSLAKTSTLGGIALLGASPITTASTVSSQKRDDTVVKHTLKIESMGDEFSTPRSFIRFDTSFIPRNMWSEWCKNSLFDSHVEYDDVQDSDTTFGPCFNCARLLLETRRWEEVSWYNRPKLTTTKEVHDEDGVYNVEYNILEMSPWNGMLAERPGYTTPSNKELCRPREIEVSLNPAWTPTVCFADMTCWPVVTSAPFVPRHGMAREGGPKLVDCSLYEMNSVLGVDVQMSTRLRLKTDFRFEGRPLVLTDIIDKLLPGRFSSWMTTSWYDEDFKEANI
ncbi:hypothetical protein JB92DRAFT_3099530 [Gautieria morchelliformis]|nr:hypothetical protein JB92DRAFT_3099530 [Gautieria morchelliformis]